MIKETAKYSLDLIQSLLILGKNSNQILVLDQVKANKHQVGNASLLFLRLKKVIQ